MINLNRSSKKKVNWECKENYCHQVFPTIKELNKHMEKYHKHIPEPEIKALSDLDPRNLNDTNHVAPFVRLGYDPGWDQGSLGRMEKYKRPGKFTQDKR